MARILWRNWNRLGSHAATALAVLQKIVVNKKRRRSQYERRLFCLIQVSWFNA